MKSETMGRTLTAKIALSLTMAIGTAGILLLNQQSPAMATAPLLTKRVNPVGQTIIVEHKVKRGETLWAVSRQYEVSVTAIAIANNIEPSTKIRAGQTLKIPSLKGNGQSANELAPEARTDSKIQDYAAIPILITPAQNPVYRVQPGDTLNSIARRHGVSLAELIQANKITDPNLIEVDQEFKIPGTHLVANTNSSQTGLIEGITLPVVPSQKSDPEELIVVVTTPDSSSAEQELDFLPEPEPVEKLKADVQRMPQQSSQQIAVAQAPRENDNLEPETWATYPVEVETYNLNLEFPVGAIVAPELPPLSSPEQYLPDSPPRFNGFDWPARGVLSSGYGPRRGRMHKGIDIAAPVGTPIFAAAPGEVVSAGWNNGGYGNLVKVSHPNGSLTLYAHNSKILVSKGQQVQQGQKISEMGSTGYSTGPHLHFELHHQGRGAVNPIAFLPKRR